MKNLILIAIAFFTLNVVAQEEKIKATTINKKTTIASQDQKIEALARIETKKLTKELELSSDQQKTVNTIMLAHFKKRLNVKQKMKQVLSSKEKTDKRELKKTVKKAQDNQIEELNSELKHVLTSDQYQKYLILKKDKVQQKTKAKKY